MNIEIILFFEKIMNCLLLYRNLDYVIDLILGIYKIVIILFILWNEGYKIGFLFKKIFYYINVLM